MTLKAARDLTGEAWIDIGTFSVDSSTARTGTGTLFDPTTNVEGEFGQIDDPSLRLNGDPDLQFDSSTDTITRSNATFTGSVEFALPVGTGGTVGIERAAGWAGFSAGDFITIKGATLSSPVGGITDFDGIFNIARISGNVLLLNGLDFDEVFDTTFGTVSFDNFMVDSEYEVVISVYGVGGTTELGRATATRTNANTDADVREELRLEIAAITNFDATIVGNDILISTSSQTEFSIEVFEDTVYINAANVEEAIRIPLTNVTVVGNVATWITDGFAAGQTITIEGAGANDGNHTVASVSHDILTLNENVQTDSKPAASSDIRIRAQNADGGMSGSILGQITAIARDRTNPGQDAATSFIVTQLLPGQEALSGVGGIIGQVLDIELTGSFSAAFDIFGTDRGGIDPIGMPIFQPSGL